ncbi:MAG: DUF2828 family protein [Paludibacteraceae bacterium]|nr:DUF2828 family protein [Paludibacteraceae bacterium]
MTQLKNEISNEKQYTENGAVGYRTTGKALLDLNFGVASLRRASDIDIIDKFIHAYFEDKIVATKWLFYARDVREGLGERRLFRVVMEEFAQQEPKALRELLKFVPEYGRWDDLWCLLDTKLADDVVALVQAQLTEDFNNMVNGKSISLCAKWMPSINASSETTKKYASMMCKKFKDTPASYRKFLSKMRKYLDVVECKMSAKEWNAINYETVPSRANLIYNSAFLRNDEDRRRAYLGKLEKGEAKINAGTLYPHDIVHKYGRGYNVDATLEGLWKALPDTVKGRGNTIVVADGSGSMMSRVGNDNITALEVANALAIYFAEHSSGEFKDKYITFSERPQFVDFSKAKNLREKLTIASQHNEVANTNIEAVFDLILATAVNNHMAQEDIPANILIVSDMEFDSCATTNSVSPNRGYWYFNPVVRPTATLFETIEQKYKAAGYKLPRLVFWNVNSRTGTIPVKQNDLGVALVSGFSVNIVNMVMSNKTDPYECLLEVLNTERYQPIEDAIKDIL